ncbi:MAG: hypothetical protein KY443_01400 [Actinobacteria bacterium]|nr:hypothetical protein [Actinomycetota bacterium]
MDALEALEPERSLPDAVRRKGRRSAPGGGLSAEQLREVTRATWQLPVLLAGRWSPAVALVTADAALRLQAALWELASRKQVTVGPQADAGDVARRLAEQGSLAPGAARAIAILADVLGHDGYDVEACRLTARVIAHLELRARFG